MPKAGKVTKNKVIHPNSRAAAHLGREVVRNERLERRQKVKNVKLESLGKKLLWFQERLDPDKKVYKKEEIHGLACQYMDRFADELEQIDIVNTLKGRSGGQHQGRKDAIVMTMEQEQNEFVSHGLDVPDLMNGKAVQYLREWNGELRYVQNIVLRKIKEKDGKTSESKESNECEMKESEECEESGTNQLAEKSSCE